MPPRISTLSNRSSVGTTNLGRHTLQLDICVVTACASFNGDTDAFGLEVARMSREQ